MIVLNKECIGIWWGTHDITGGHKSYQLWGSFQYFQHRPVGAEINFLNRNFQPNLSIFFLPLLYVF